jgi:hypothetical protein
VLLGRELGVPVPVNAALQRLANRAAAEHRPPGSMSPEQVLAEAAVFSDSERSRVSRDPRR